MAYKNEEIPNQLKEDSDTQQDLKKYEEETFTSLIKQIQVEFDIAQRFAKPRFSTINKRLRLYNNQMRDLEAVGDPLLYTVFNTVLAAIYEDLMVSEWRPGEEGDKDQADNIQYLAEYDYDQMQKARFDFDWNFNALFGSHGIASFSRFDRETLTPIPEVWNMTTFYIDPRAVAINGDNAGKNAARFFGRPIHMSKMEIEQHMGMFDRRAIYKGKNDVSTDSEEEKRARDDAAGRQNIPATEQQNEALGDNREFELLEWHTYWKGQKCTVYLANDKKTIHLYQVEKGEWWPVADRVISPIPNQWDGVSIPDLVEDKQRGRAMVQNLMIKALRADLHPMYIYDKNRLKNVYDAANFRFNKFVPIEGKNRPISDAIMPLNKANPRLDFANYILDTLDEAAQRATATPDVQQGVLSDQKRTLGEINLVAGKSDTRYSLFTKILGWSENDFWVLWYKQYYEHLNGGIDEKVIDISGPFGTKWIPLKRKDVIGRSIPKLRIESKFIIEQEKIQKVGEFQSWASLVMQDPTANGRYVIRKLGELRGYPRQEIERALPPTIDERRAEQENESLNENKFVQVQVNDDHIAHLDIHKSAKETPATFAHIKTHEEALLVKRDNPELFPQSPDQQAAQAGQGQAAPTAAQADIVSSSNDLVGDIAGGQGQSRSPATVVTRGASSPQPSQGI